MSLLQLISNELQIWPDKFIFYTITYFRLGEPAYRDLLTSFYLSLYGLHVLNRDVHKIQTKKTKIKWNSAVNFQVRNNRLYSSQNDLREKSLGIDSQTSQLEPEYPRGHRHVYSASDVTLHVALFWHGSLKHGSMAVLVSWKGVVVGCCSVVVSAETIGNINGRRE